MKRDFEKALRERIVLADGAMGTMLYAKGIFINTCFDELNLTRASLVQEIHEEYIDAGAEIIETNTFGSNRFKLGAFGLEDRVKAINEAGARIARKAAGKKAYVAGSIGPLGKPLRPLGKITPEQALEAFREQAEALRDERRSFHHRDDAQHRGDENRGRCRSFRLRPPRGRAGDLFRRGTDSHGRVSRTGRRSSSPLSASRPWGAIAASAPSRCSKSSSGCASSPMGISPRCRTPARRVSSTAGFIYLTSPEYMAEYAKRFIQTGVSLIGGCCGTTPQHIKAMAGAIRALRPVQVHVVETPHVPREEKTLPETPFSERSRFANALGKRFVISVEIDPPRGLDPARALEAARMLKVHGVHVINIADGPRASARMSPMVLATLIERNVGIETLLHYCCRDRNLLGMQADLIGAHASGLRNVLIITGDPPKLGDYPSATAVFDVDSIGLVRIVKNMNRGIDLAGNPIGGTTSFAIGVGANPGAVDLETEVRRFREKTAAGAEFVLTQPVYEARLLENFLELTRDSTLPVLVGLLPLTSSKNAEFLHNEVPGMQIPQRIRDMMTKAPAGDHARALGIEIAREALKECSRLPRVAGAYIMPPFGRHEAALQVIDGAF